MDYVKLVPDKINSEEILSLVTSPKCGAISTFIGITRDNFENKTVWHAHINTPKNAS